MRFLIDTQVMLWWLEQDKRLSENALSALASPDSAVFASIASLWEISIKHGLGKLPANAAQVGNWLDHWSISILGISRPHLAVLERLPLRHRDPFDRLIVAQAISEGLAVMTSDDEIVNYDVPIIPATK